MATMMIECWKANNYLYSDLEVFKQLLVQFKIMLIMINLKFDNNNITLFHLFTVKMFYDKLKTVEKRNLL
jgi:hypothetical protein